MTHALPAHRRRRARPAGPRSPLAACTRAACLGFAAASPAVLWAQDAPTPTPPAELQRVEITGSSIKRIDGEGALPVQVVTREDIQKAGVTTAAEIMAKISANSGGLTDGASINVGGYDQKGFNSANLRGIGTSSTLVLLNGRRMANFASPGDDSGVDLNNIPAAALERVEILLDGASAIYGTEAIGGVINFITRKDYAGAEVNLYASGTKEGGAGKRAASIAAGTGDIERDRFNLMGVFDVQRTDALRSSQRSFIPDLDIPNRLGNLLSGYTSPANIRLTRDQRDYLQEQNFTIGGKPIVNRLINLSAPACNPPANIYLPGGTGGEDACTYDYMRDTELYPRSEKLNFLGRGVWQLNANHQLFAEALLSRSKTYYVGSSTRQRIDLPIALIPQLADAGLDGVDGDTVSTQARLLEAGNRTSELTSTAQRYVVGLTGTLGGWDYDAALNHSVNRVGDVDGRGYLLYDETIAAIEEGKINLFGPSSAEGKQLLESYQIHDNVRKARGTMDSVDAKATRSLMKLAGGDLAIALGAELRREVVDFNPSDLLRSNNILGDDAPEEGQDTHNARNVAAAYFELNAPLTKEWEVQFAVRHDHYQEIGGTTNPKLGVRYQPMKELLMRGSVGTGFRAPSISDLYRPTVVSGTSILPDPVYCAENDNDLSICADSWNTRRYSNPNLKPERSRQFSLGVVFEPSKQWSVSLDYWNIVKRDLISEIGDDVILGDLAKYGSLVHRYSDPTPTPGCDFDAEDNSICYIELRKQNQGQQRTSGLDLVAEVRSLQTPYGAFGARLSGTLVLEAKEQPIAGDTYISKLAKYVTDGVVQRWRHRLTFDWERGPVGATLGNTYYSGYEDQNSAINTDDGSVVAPNHVKAYSLWDVSARYEVTKALTIRGGIQNLFDTSPPFSNQAYSFLAGYDPSYTDPRGRSFYASLQYVFK